MEIFVGLRGVGKTRRLIEEAIRNGGVIVCRNVNRMVNKLHDYGYTGIEVIDYDTYLNEKRWEDGKQYFIRNLEELFKKMNAFSATLSAGRMISNATDEYFKLESEDPVIPILD